MAENDEREFIPRAQRLFIDSDLSGGTVVIEERAAHYVGHVLRLKAGDFLVVFNGRGDERAATVASLRRGRAELRLQERVAPMPEPALEITLVQALVKSDAMDSIVQKATELGIRKLSAVKTDFSVIRLDAARAARRLEHWRRIAQSACEQSGRHCPPAIDVFASLAQCLVTLPADALRVVFHPGGNGGLGALPQPVAGVCLLVGPEGGFSAADLRSIAAAGFSGAGLGPRTLRAGTAAVAACALAQSYWGDMR